MRPYFRVDLSIPDSSWKKIEISYIVSGRTDLAIGQDLFLSKWWKDLGKGLFQGVTTLKKQLPTKADYSVASFISGMNTNSNRFSVNIGQLSFNKTSNELQINFNCSSREDFKYINFTYIVFPRNQPYFSMVYAPYSTTNKG